MHERYHMQQWPGCHMPLMGGTGAATAAELTASFEMMYPW